MAKHEVMIIGGGTGGLRAAIISAKTGYDTALIEPAEIGGTCLNTGCIPTKTLLHAAERYQQFKESDELGIHADNVRFDFSQVMGRMREIVRTGRQHAEGSVDRIDNITLYEGKARFVSEDTVVVNGEEISADKIIIATGASPWAPPINGLDETGYMTNADALELEKLPESMLMIGGGYIACELASFFATLGTEVTILEAAPTILGMLDNDVREVVQDSLEERGVEIHTEVEITEVTGRNGDEVTATTKSGDSYTAETLLVSTGRRPNTKNLGLEKARVETTDRGHVEVNDYLQSTNENVYAIGDVNGKSPFAHAAKREARAVLENALLDGDSVVEHDVVPWAVFTFPTIGGVGLSEEQARETDRKVGVMKGEFSRVGKAKIIREEEGFVKVVYDEDTREVLGTVIIGPDAHNLIHEFALLLNTPNPCVDYVKKTIHVHPTLAEVMEELKEVK